MISKAKIAIGLGCDRGTPLETLRTAVAEALLRAGADWSSIAAAASITLKANETGLLALASEKGWKLHFFEAAELATVAVPNPSETVRRYTGTPSVSEAAAMLAAGPKAPINSLLVEKHKHLGPDGRYATVSIARMKT